MIELDEDALICDFAETYGIYDYRSLPVSTAATLAAGLRDNSRVKLKAAGAPVDQNTILLALLADRVEAFRYGFTEDAKNRRNIPTSLVSILLGEDEKSANGAMTFDSVEEFEKAYRKILGDN